MSNPSVKVTADTPDDVLWGAATIGSFINCKARRAFYLLERGLIPGRKIGDVWVSTKPELRAAVRGETAA